MKKLFFSFLCLTLALVVTSCSDEDQVAVTPTTIRLFCEDAHTDLSNFNVTIKETRSETEFTGITDAEGQISLSLPLGSFDIKAEKSANGVVTHYGSLTNYTLTEANKTIRLEVKSILDALDKTFVLDELFFNCSSNDGAYDRNMYEEYFTITNVSDRPLYADGLAFAITGDYTGTEDAQDKSPYLPDSIIVSQVYTIPGNGTQHLVQPGKSLVIAHSAIDHSEGGKKAKARDLSGADFEVFVPHEYATTVDNPEVANLKVDYSMFQAFQWGYAGNAPMILIRPGEEMSSYVQSHIKKMDITGSFMGQQGDYLIIPTSWIVDGVQTGAKDYYYHDVLPPSVDRGKVLLNEDEMMFGGFHSLFVKRKAAADGYLQDTNNSTDDFEVIEGGQKNYPKK